MEENRLYKKYIYISKEPRVIIEDYCKEHRINLVMRFINEYNLKKFLETELRNLNGVDYLILDLQAITNTTSEEEITSSIELIRRMYNVRIIILAEGYKEGNVLLGRLFNLGIYNIVTAKNDVIFADEIERAFSVEGMTFGNAMKYKINYSKVNKNIDKIRQESKKWLLSSITYKAEETKDKFVKIEENDLCCGCTACYSACPKNAIRMVRDNEGFLYPEVDREKCVNCGMCKKVCPILNKAKLNEFKPKAYLFQNSNEEIRKDSTSGGIFTAIGEFVIKNNGIVYGATFDDNFVVNHIGVESTYELCKFRKSKYVQSNQNNCFKEIKQYLDNGKLVCYSGTPCQVGGLRTYLRKDYENLILVDIMCHSVPSPLVFEKYKGYILKKMNANKILNINFRDKNKYGYKYSMMTVETDNGIYSQGIDTDPYLRAFFSDVSVRPSCYNCHFKTMKRVSDLTIWDCFNINEIDKSFDDDKGTTRVLVQSEKGEKLLENLDDVRLKELDINIATKKVKEMTNSVNYNDKRKKFFENINDDNVFEKYYPTNFKTEVNSFVRKALAITGIYSSVKSLAKKILRK